MEQKEILRTLSSSGEISITDTMSAMSSQGEELSVNDKMSSTVESISVVYPAVKHRTWFLSVEPVLFLHNMATYFVWVSSQDLMLSKACKIKLDLPSYVCSDLSNHEESENEAQSLVSDLLMWRSILETAIKLITVPLLGWWGDKFGRRNPIIFSLVGLGLEASYYAINSIFFEWPLEAIIGGSFFYALSGGSHALIMLCFAHMAETSTQKRRTFRVGILDGFYYLGSPIGLALVAPLLSAVGYAGTFACAVAIYIITIIYVFAVIPKRENEIKKESKKITEETLSPSTPTSTISNSNLSLSYPPNHTASPITNHTSTTNQTNTRCVQDFGLEHAFEAFEVTVKKRPSGGRRIILLLILAMLLDSFAIWGESIVKYLFVTAALDWDYTQYSHWGTLDSLLNVFGALVILPFLTVRLRVSDSVIGLLGAASRTGSRIFYASASVGRAWLMYVGSVFGVGAALAPIAIRSLLSKVAGVDEVGQVYAVMAVGESMLPFLSAPIFTSVYDATIDSYKGAFYLLSAAVNACMFICFLYVMYYLKRNRTSGQISDQGELLASSSMSSSQ